MSEEVGLCEILRNMATACRTQGLRNETRVIASEAYEDAARTSEKWEQRRIAAESQALGQAAIIAELESDNAVLLKAVRKYRGAFEIQDARVSEMEIGAMATGEAGKDAARLRSIFDNGLCRAWLTECDEPNPTWEEFLIMLDHEVAEDADERTSEFQETLRQAMKEPCNIPLRRLNDEEGTRINDLETTVAGQKLYIASCQGALERMELALRGLLADREYQRLSGPPHFTSTLTEYRDKEASAKFAWDNAAKAVAD